MINAELQKKLVSDPLRRQLVGHPFFREVQTAPLDKSAVAKFLGQWWHPLHYFPDFLARSIAAVPWLEAKTALSRILDEEAGEGNPEQAHERIYIKTMTDVGFNREDVSEAAPFPETKELVEGYRRATDRATSAIGFAYGTEVADLAMVAGIGRAVSRITGETNLPWVEIHISQEPNHVARVNSALGLSFDESDESAVLKSAQEMWRLWIAFFSRLQREMFSADVAGCETAMQLEVAGEGLDRAR